MHSIFGTGHLLPSLEHTNTTRKNECDDFSIHWRHFNIYYSRILMDYVEFKLLYGALKAIALNFPSTHRANHLPQKNKKRMT
ncbi:hypothetical protein N750_10380 [Legionella pneumophila str. Leg01/53]|nr:hypothetical protein N750_10380 [Legionella pneumophila str. Leg01/53]